MACLRFGPHRVEARAGESVRDALLSAGLSPHNGRARWLNCKGLGTCGTCAVRIEGPIAAPGLRERARFHVPPHTPGTPLRLACQVHVGDADLTIVKHPGFWGQDVDAPPVTL